MTLTADELEAISITVDHNSRKLAIVYGSLGTLITFASLVFAVLTWRRSHQQRLAAQQEATGDLELQSNNPQDIGRAPLGSHESAIVSHEYGSTENQQRLTQAYLV
jgi:hypothetical protein